MWDVLVFRSFIFKGLSLINISENAVCDSVGIIREAFGPCILVQHYGRSRVLFGDSPVDLPGFRLNFYVQNPTLTINSILWM